MTALLTEVEILFKNDALLVALKPAGVVSEAGAEKSMPSLIAECCDGFTPYTVHRLDREVSGLMVYASSPEAAAELSRQIQSGELQKEYIAILCGSPEDEGGELCDLLYHDRQRNKTYVVDRRRRGVREAKLRYTVLGSAELDGKLLTAVAVQLLTGRTHQIRAQFASRGLSLYGDARYGGTKAARIALHSFRLSFKDPVTKKQITVTDLPDKYGSPFDLFAEQVRKA